MNDINLWLDSYQDLYSDFDSRHYLKRRISEDFIHEIRLEIKNKEKPSPRMILFLPADQRDLITESRRAESLIKFFTEQSALHQNKYIHSRNKGVWLLISGVILMLLNSWGAYQFKDSFPFAGIKVLIEPAAWFLLWSGFDFLFYNVATLKKEWYFFRNLSEMDIEFKST